jgi:hypothetical protein
MERSPARQISITKGVHIQVSTMMMDHLAMPPGPSMEKDEAVSALKQKMKC